MVFNGGTHILPMSFAALGSFSLFAAIAKRDWRPLVFVGRVRRRGRGLLGAEAAAGRGSS